MGTTPSTRCEREAWLAVVLSSLLIFAIVPVARATRDQVNALLGASSFGFLTIAIIVATAAIAAAIVLRRLRELGWVAAAWTTGVAAVLIMWTLRLWAQPEEAFHLVEYGALSMLATNALRHRTPDRSMFIQAILIAASVGVVDEVIQWTNPTRYFGFRDIGINAGAAALAQIALWQGLMRGPRPPVSARSLLRCCVLGIVFLALFGVTLGFTPERAEKLATKILWLRGLPDHEDCMGEYGHLHVVDGIGRFKSRFTLAELDAIDRTEGAAAGAMMSPRNLGYDEFLRSTSRVTRAFPREARIHLSSRNRQLGTARAATNDAALRAAATVAWRENLILERFYGNTLQHARARLDPSVREWLEQWTDPDLAFSSKVDRHLITAVSEAQALGLVALAILSLAVIGVIASRRARGQQ